MQFKCALLHVLFSNVYTLEKKIIKFYYKNTILQLNNYRVEKYIFRIFYHVLISKYRFVFMCVRQALFS